MCLDIFVPFASEEKEYIYQWVEEHLNTGTICIPWKLLQIKVEEKFKRLRSQDDLKNVWNEK